MQFEARLTEHEGYPMLYLSGELDLSSEQTIRGFFDQIVEGNRCAIIHVTDVTYADSTAVGQIMRTRKEFNDRNGTVAFVCCDANVLRVLQILGLADHLDTFNDVAEAVEYLRTVCPEPKAEHQRTMDYSKAST